MEEAPRPSLVSAQRLGGPARGEAGGADRGLMPLHKQSLRAPGFLPGDGVSKLGPSWSPDPAAGGCSPAPTPATPCPSAACGGGKGCRTHIKAGVLQAAAAAAVIFHRERLCWRHPGELTSRELNFIPDTRQLSGVPDGMASVWPPGTGAESRRAARQPQGTGLPRAQRAGPWGAGGPGLGAPEAPHRPGQRPSAQPGRGPGVFTWR